MDELINRQAAIEAVTKYCLKYDLRELLADIECLPTAEKRGEWIPGIDGNYIIWECSECHVESEAWTEYCPICGSRNIEINREAVIDETDEAAYEEALEEFRKNPKAYTLDEVEAELGLTAEKKGKWMSSRPDAPMFGFHFCSICGRTRTSPQDNYCPNCGARMEESDGEI